MSRAMPNHLTLLWVALALLLPTEGAAQEELPIYLRDRGTGIASSMFGTYVRKGELLVYPFYEYYHDDNIEYEPAEFGFGLAQEFRGRYRANEFLLFLGLGLTDWLAVELEAAVIDAKLTKSSADTSSQPTELKESGLGDVESQVRWRWAKESPGSPEVFSYFETVFPLQKDRVLIGTRDWEFKLGAGIIKGFRWGTVTLRSEVGYDRAERKIESAEYALEYLKRISRLIRIATLIEGEEDEVELIADLQLHVSPGVFVRLNSGFGLTSKATDVAPEIGVLFSFFVR